MSKELMEIGGFITEGAEIVNHDNSLSGNGTSASPLGVVTTWINVTSACDVRNISNDSSMTFVYSPALGLVNWTFKFKANAGGTMNTAYRVCTIPAEYRPYSKFEIATPDGNNFCDYFPENGYVIPRNSTGYFSNSMTWPVSSLVQ